ncbi:hypothetical protein CPB83DRAFT_842948 [Crepidotus variabilis]|uniref:Uncharacterized protein n=1 Tax=Crepidotus variabilis TaxID=179855 RepID=A0A9P6ERJ8_9AGAR|nr:hypothetical protein CPB83DRAFT_842948 [Crepidotus variabilis]
MIQVACLRVVIPVSAISLRLVVTLAQTFLEKSGDIVGNSLKLLITIGLCCLETPGYVPSDERH